MVCPSVSVGWWAVMWFCMLGVDLKAMGQLGHLWNISQWACWMWDFTELSPPNTTRQLEHLQRKRSLTREQRNKGNMGIWISAGRYHTCIRCGVQSANRSRPGVSETAAARLSTHTRGRCAVCSLGGCVDELLHCSCWTGAWEENTLCRTGEQQKKKRIAKEWNFRMEVSINFHILGGKKKKPFPHSHKTHSGLCWFDFLKMFSHFFFAAELSLTLGTFITDVLHCLCFFVGYCFVWLGFGVWGGLA